MAVLKSVLCMYIKLAIMPGVLVVLAVNFGDWSAIAGVKVGLLRSYSVSNGVCKEHC